MSRFFTYHLPGQNQAGARLKIERERQGFTLEQVGHHLHIPVKYLLALEQGDETALPGANYYRYFVRAYADFLQLPPAVLLSADKAVLSKQDKVGIRRPIKIAQATVHPYRLLMIAAATMAVGIYLVSAAWSALVPPPLRLFAPADDQTSLSATTLVRGQTQAGTPIVINGQAVAVNEKGDFVQEVALKPGLNVIMVTAQKTYSRPTTITRRVIFTPATTVSLIK